MLTPSFSPVKNVLPGTKSVLLLLLLPPDLPLLSCASPDQRPSERAALTPLAGEALAEGQAQIQLPSRKGPVTGGTVVPAPLLLQASRRCSSALCSNAHNAPAERRADRPLSQRPEAGGRGVRKSTEPSPRVRPSAD